MKYIAVLLTVYNRKTKTLLCLQKLYDSFNQFDGHNNYLLDIYLTDDGSTDGTSEAVRNQFPKVKILKGSGTLYWNRGMINSWQYATRLQPNFYLWLNDDTYLFDNAFTTLLKGYEMLKNKNSILVGATKSKITGITTYSAENKRIKLSPNNLLQLCDTFNGNFVLVPKSVFDRIGMLDSNYSHSLGDFDYGWTATKTGISSYLLPEFIGFCEFNAHIKVCFNPEVSFISRLKNLYSPLGCNPIEFFKFDCKHFGILKAVLHFFSIHYKSLFPKNIKQ